MSYVTNVLLHVGVCEEVTLEQINATASEQEGQSLNDLSWGDIGKSWGGNKYPEVKLSGAAFNYLRKDEFMAHLAQLPWTNPDEVQMFIKDQQDYRFTIYRLVAQEWVALNSDEPRQCMSELDRVQTWFVHAYSHLAPVASDESFGYEFADTAQHALSSFAAKYKHPAGLLAAAAYRSAYDYHRGAAPRSVLNPKLTTIVRSDG